MTWRRPRRGRRTSRPSRTRSGPATTPPWTTCRSAAGYSRVGHHGGGAGRFIDAHDWTVASFFQHTSRTDDPQLHIHNGILWRVLCADGQWRTLDSKSLELHRPAAGAIAARTMFEHAGKQLARARGDAPGR